MSSCVLFLCYILGYIVCHLTGVIAVDLAREMLELYPNSYVLVVSHENISNAFYTGKDPSMLLINCLFRANGEFTERLIIVHGKHSDFR